MRLGRLLLNLAAAAGLLLAVEGWCSLREKPPKYRASYSLGYELAPGYVGRRETVNRAGLRGVEIGPKRAGSFRILAMGGSTTWGHKVRDDETWPVALERELRAVTGADIEVLNGGVSGYDLEHVVRALHERYLEQFEPDLVIVFVGWNLPQIDNPVLHAIRAQVSAAQRRDGPYRSALVRRIARSIAEWQEDPNGAQDPRPAHEIAASRAQRYPPQFAELRRLADAQGARVVALRYPCLIQRPAPAGGDARPTYEAALHESFGGDRDLGTLVDMAEARYAEGLAAVVDSATQAEIPILDVAARLEAELPAADADAVWAGYFNDHAHFTAAGNDALGRALAHLLVEQGLVAPP